MRTDLYLKKSLNVDSAQENGMHFVLTLYGFLSDLYLE